jgi:hypothetical protein
MGKVSSKKKWMLRKSSEEFEQYGTNFNDYTGAGVSRLVDKCVR